MLYEDRAVLPERTARIISAQLPANLTNHIGTVPQLGSLPPPTFAVQQRRRFANKAVIAILPPLVGKHNDVQRTRRLSYASRNTQLANVRIEPIVPVLVMPKPETPKAAVDEPTVARIQVSSWMIWRPDGSPQTLAREGQLGASQFGVRATLPVLQRRGHEVALSARLSAPLKGKAGREAAIGLSLRPKTALPLEILVERRFALEGKDRTALFAATGIYDKPVGPFLKANGYAQLGLVGRKRRDAFVDGSLTLEHDIIVRNSTAISIGAGIWGGAQPGARRLDAGPNLTIRLQKPLPARLSAQWRVRTLGNVRPKGGPAITIGTDF